MTLRKVLMIEDSEDVQTLLRDILEPVPNAELLSATTLTEGEHLFRTHVHDLALIIVDGCVDSQNMLDSLPLIHRIRRVGYSGPMWATSNHQPYRALMLQAGCTREVEKGELPEAIPAFFNRI